MQIIGMCTTFLYSIESLIKKNKLQDTYCCFGVRKTCHLLVEGNWFDLKNSPLINTVCYRSRLCFQGLYHSTFEDLFQSRQDPRAT